jgi:hypothetical protein
MNSGSEITHNSEQSSGPNVGQAQAAEVAVVACAHCNVNLRKTGFVEVKTTFQSYVRDGGKLVKSNKLKSEDGYIRCPLCATAIDDEDSAALLGEKA